MPEVRSGVCKFNRDLMFRRSRLGHANYPDELFVPAHDIPKSKYLAGPNFHSESQQGTMGINDGCVGVFRQRSIYFSAAAHLHADARQNSLAAPRINSNWRSL